MTTIHHEHGRTMIPIVGVHRSDDTKIVNARPNLGEDVADFSPASAVLSKVERRSHQVARSAVSLYLGTWHRFPVMLCQLRLRIERVHLRHPAIQIEKDDVLRLRCEVGCFDGERIRCACFKCVCQTQKAKSASELLQSLASIHRRHLTVLNSVELNRTCAY